MDSRRWQYQTDAQGRRAAIALPLAEHEQSLDDLDDLAIAAERRDQPTVDLEELKKRRLAGDGAA